MPDTDELLRFIQDNVEVGDNVTIETTRTTVTAPVTRLDPLTLDPTSGVTIEYQLLSDGSVVETRWDDSPSTEEGAVREETHGLLQDVRLPDDG